ncbi:3-hydroxy-3-methylglutaryl-CoA reductase [Verrucomicrobia bacterium LW23]|nr:3-hydroxy-3-methylglutaryl-CoA reductase [Verrucomicrobia bacterium LW23]
MSTSSQGAAAHLQRLVGEGNLDSVLQRLKPQHHPLPARFTGATSLSRASVEQRWGILAAAPASPERSTTIAAARAVLDPASAANVSGAADASASVHSNLAPYARNIEYAVGTVQLPIGIAGPLRINGSCTAGDFYVPLATTEAALVASYQRGAMLISEAGGCAAALLAEGVTRAPGLVFETVAQAGAFIAWAVTQEEAFAVVAASTTRHGRLTRTRMTVEGNHVYLSFEYLTGDAAGQNMVTLATDAICDYIVRCAPIKPRRIFVEANLSGDKKACTQSFQSVRGKKVCAEVIVPDELIRKRLHTTAADIAEYWAMTVLGGVISGTIGVQGHYANGLAALFIATGQDAACVSEAAVGITRFQLQGDGSLYACVTLPNLIVGTVGGGTGLPTQAACLDILGLRGAGHARSLAEVAAALALAGELSIVGALSAGEFAQAHRKLARRAPAPSTPSAA